VTAAPMRGENYRCV